MFAIALIAIALIAIVIVAVVARLVTVVMNDRPLTAPRSHRHERTRSPPACTASSDVTTRSSRSRGTQSDAAGCRRPAARPH